MDLHRIPGLSPTHEKRLREAGVTTLEELARADPLDLAARTGVPEEAVGRWIVHARETPRERHAAPNPPPPTGPMARLREQAEQWRVTLREKADSARVTVGNVVYENVPIVTAKLKDAEERVARELQTNAVIIREKAETARVRIGETWRNDVPIFQERVREGAQRIVQEVRVRIKEIREKKDEK